MILSAFFRFTFTNMRIIVKPEIPERATVNRIPNTTREFNSMCFIIADIRRIESAVAGLAATAVIGTEASVATRKRSEIGKGNARETVFAIAVVIRSVSAARSETAVVNGSGTECWTGP